MSRSKHDTALDIVKKIEERVQRDEGNRGLDALIQPNENELYNAARELLTKQCVAITTGFPCLVDFTPPTETDGPPGAIAVADLLLKLGKTVYILTDECNEEPMLSCVARSGIFSSGKPLQDGYPSRLILESFPARTNFDDTDAERLSDILDVIDCVVAIERVGPAADGNCYTMQGLSMNHLAAPLELLLINPPEVNADIIPKNPYDNGRVVPVTPASVLAMEDRKANQHDEQLSEDDRAALLSLLQSDAELTDEQFELLSCLAPLSVDEASIEMTDAAKEKSDVNWNAGTETEFEVSKHDYSNCTNMTMDELMAELPPPPKNHHSQECMNNDAEFSVDPDNNNNNLTFNSNIASIGIGDGGNEIGMGKIRSMVSSSQIPNASTIACVIPTDHLLAASVSNWGGYALVAAMVVILLHEGDEIEDEYNTKKHNDNGKHKNEMMKFGAIVDSLSCSCACPRATSILSTEVLNTSCAQDLVEKSLFLKNQYLTSREQQLRACQGLLDAGARDGISKECALTVDGMPFDISLKVLDDVNDIVLASLVQL